MTTLGLGMTLDENNPALPFIAQRNGSLEDLYSLEFQIFDVSTEAKFLTPLQVYPATEGDRAVVDVSDTGDRLGIGRYFAPWEIPSDPDDFDVGAYKIRWFWKWEASGLESKAEQDFEVLAAAPSYMTNLYARVADLRAEGFSSTVLTDARALTSIMIASQLIEKFTGRVFVPYYADHRLNGRGGTMVLSDDVIIGIEEFMFETSPLYPSSLPITVDMFRVYNRHLSGLVQPDDRNNPKVEVFNLDGGIMTNRALAFQKIVVPKGQQNVSLKGVFGYTDPDGTPFGRTPWLLSRACLMLARREYVRMSDCDSWEDARRRWRLVSERTRDQSYNLDTRNPLFGAFTGDAEIDQLIVMFCRPPSLGAA